MLKLKIAAVILLVAIIGTMGGLIRYLSIENNRLGNNQKILFEKKNGLHKELILSKTELKDYIKSDESLSSVLQDSLQIKEKDIKRLIKASQNSRVIVKTKIRDSIVYERDTFYIYKAFNWTNGWYNAKGKIDLISDSLDMQILSIDTLYVLDNYYKDGKWFLPKLFERRKVKIDVINKNPYNKVNIERVVGLK